MKHDVSECSGLAWKPIIAGGVFAFGLSFLLHLFTIAIGLTAYTSNNNSETLVFGGLLGTSIGIVASMFAAGWFSGYLGQSYCSKRHLGAFYGFLTWCFALILGIFMASHLPGYISFYGHFLSGTTDAMSANAVASVMKPKNVEISTYVLFILFFLSAFSCSLGGHCGMRHTSRN